MCIRDRTRTGASGRRRSTTPRAVAMRSPATITRPRASRIARWKPLRLPPTSTPAQQVGSVLTAVPTLSAAFLRGAGPLLRSCVGDGLDAEVRLAAGGGGVPRARGGERARAARVPPPCPSPRPGRVPVATKRAAPGGEPPAHPGGRGAP